MTNPWLSIPLGDYEGHMSLPNVRQLRPLSELFKRTVEHVRPKSVAVLGVAGGNGLEHLADAGVLRIVAIDINMEYLETTRYRFRKFAGLELHCVDLTVDRISLKPVDLVHAALIFEHAGTEKALDNAVSLVGRNGRLSVVLQIPSAEQVPAALSTYASMQALRDHFTFVDRDLLEASLEDRGFIRETEQTLRLPGNKAFWYGVFARAHSTSQ